MLITVTLTSIIVITVLVWLTNRILLLRLRSRSVFQICPICAGVTGTWLWLIMAHFLGYRIVLTIPALLIGGTVVGVMTKLERLVEPKFVLVWKTIFVISGFLAANSLISGIWPIFVIGIILALIATFAFKTRKIKLDRPESGQIKELEKKIKNCC